MKSFIRDSTEFLNRHPPTVSSDCILISFDTERLYSYTSHDPVLETVEYWLEKYPKEIKKKKKNDISWGKKDVKFTLAETTYISTHYEKHAYLNTY